MKIAVTVARWITGLLFIFSGLVKAIDPRGLAYKMQEFFEAWANAGFMKELMQTFGQFALAFSIVMITLEVLVGLAILLGWRKKISTWLLFLLMLFFTFLTSYVLFSGKIKACGCFGDCIPLTPIQTFTKDIVLLILSLLLLFGRKYILPAAKPLILTLIMVFATIATLFLQWWVLRHLPLVDCLAFKKGSDLIEARKMPANAVADTYEMSFVYEKDGSKQSFPVDALPDSSWTFVERTQKLAKAGTNNIPLINDFNLTTVSGNDTTTAIFTQDKEYYLFFITGLSNYPRNWKGDTRLFEKAQAENRQVFIVTSQTAAVTDYFVSNKNISNPIIFSCDATAIKTAARANPTLYLMKGPIVLNKWGWADL